MGSQVFGELQWRPAGVELIPSISGPIEAFTSKAVERARVGIQRLLAVTRGGRQAGTDYLREEELLLQVEKAIHGLMRSGVRVSVQNLITWGLPIGRTAFYEHLDHYDLTWPALSRRFKRTYRHRSTPRSNE
jgi:hypothetical protein